MKKIKFLLIILVFVPCMFILGACGDSGRLVTDIQRVSSNGVYDIYQIEYNDGTNGSITVKNGENGHDLTLDEMYNTAVENGFEGTILEFMREYLTSSFSSETEEVIATNKALLSTVAITCEFPTINTSFWGAQSKSKSMGSGAGVVLYVDHETGDATIITNFHVVYYSGCTTTDHLSSNIMCYLYGSPISRTTKTDNEGNVVNDEDGYPIVEYDDYAIQCSFVGGSMTYDLAVLQITGSEAIKNSSLTPVRFANSDEVTIGATAIAVGNPEGMGISATRGVINVESEVIPMQAADDVTQVNCRVIRTDASINGGNSGGGLYNSNGELVGIVNSKIVKQNIENMAFAIPSNIVSRVANNILRNSATHNKKAYRAVFGLTVEARDRKATYNELLRKTVITEDVYVAEIKDDSLISTSSIAVGDKILKIAINGTEYTISKFYQISDLTWMLVAGDVVGFYVEGRQDPINVIISEDCFVEVD